MKKYQSPKMLQNIFSLAMKYKYFLEVIKVTKVPKIRTWLICLPSVQWPAQCLGRGQSFPSCAVAHMELWKIFVGNWRCLKTFECLYKYNLLRRNTMVFDGANKWACSVANTVDKKIFCCFLKSLKISGKLKFHTCCNYMYECRSISENNLE